MNKFYWGTATSAFQIEGSLSNDFTEWERLGKFRENGSNPLYEEGSDHWNRWKEDYDYLSKLQLNAYRFSVEWARLEPRRNQYSKSAIKQYSEMIDYLLKLDIEPFVTLHHFTHPTMRV